jgi:hypothetical protein
MANTTLAQRLAEKHNRTARQLYDARMKVAKLERELRQAHEATYAALARDEMVGTRPGDRSIGTPATLVISRMTPEELAASKALRES